MSAPNPEKEKHIIFIGFVNNEEFIGSKVHRICKLMGSTYSFGEKINELSTPKRIIVVVPQIDPPTTIKNNTVYKNALTKKIKICSFAAFLKKHDFLSPFDNAASLIHDEWMKRNPLQNWNKDQHVPFDLLPEEEKAKDRSHIFTIIGIMLEYQNQNKGRVFIIDQFGSIAHDKWRQDYFRKNGNTPRMKKVTLGSGGDQNNEVDITVPWPQLHREWKKENLDAGAAAYDAVIQMFSN